MGDKQAKPGDWIIITSPRGYHDKYLVVACPEDRKDGPVANEVWIEMCGGVYHLGNALWEVIERGTGSVMNDDVDEHQKHQMNDNLAEVFSGWIS